MEGMPPALAELFALADDDLRRRALDELTALVTPMSDDEAEAFARAVIESQDRQVGGGGAAKAATHERRPAGRSVPTGPRILSAPGAVPVL